MKKILFTLAAAAMVLGAASCQKDNLGQIKEVKTVDNPLNTILVKVASDTKLAVDSENLTPAFEENDVIFGWDKDGNTYAYTCTEVTEDAATFTRTSSGAPSADEGTTINLVYAPGYDADDIVDKTLDVNLAVQGETLPVVMHATGEVDAQGECAVEFSNDVAIVDIKDAVLPGAAENEEYTIAFLGKNTSLKFALSEFGFLNYESAVEGPISSSVKAKASADSKISKRFAVPASLEATDVIITATAADGSSYEFSAGSKEIVAGKYITVTGKEFDPQYVAQIGSDKYMTLAKAVAAANAATEDVTVMMLEDAESSSALNINNANSKKVTLDLNGCTLSSQIIVTTDFEVADATGEGVVEAAEKTIKMGNDGDFGVNAIFTFNGGTIKTLNGNYAISADGIKNGAQPTVLIKKGNIIGTGGNAVRIKYATATFGDETEGDINLTAQGYQYAIWTSTSADVTINKGTYTLTEGTKALYYFGDGSSKVTINDGTFTSDIAMFGYYKTTTNSTIDVQGGKFSWDGSPFFQEGNTNGSVSGGWFTNSVAGFEAPGYICVDSSEEAGYSYKVIENTDKSVIEVAGIKFETVAAAIEEANKATEPTTIKLLQNVEITESIVFTTSAPLTFDLNGHNLVAANLETATPAIVMDVEGVDLTIEDNSEGAKGSIDQAYKNTAYAIRVYTGKLTVNSGTICNTSSTGTGRWAMSITGTEGKAAAIVNINGGHIFGGRGIYIGSGIAGIIPEINITGGTIETTNTSTTSTSDFYQYGALCFSQDYYTCRMTGGALVANTTTCFYTNRKEEGSIFIIGDPDDDTKIPYFWVKSSDGFSFRSGSGDASARVKIYNAYCNNKTQKNSIFSKNGVSAHDLDPVVTYDGREYNYKICK